MNNKETPDFDEVFREVFKGKLPGKSPPTLADIEDDLSHAVDEFFGEMEVEGVDKKEICIVFLMLCSKGFLKLPDATDIDAPEWWDEECEERCSAAYVAMTDLLTKLTDEEIK